MSDVSERLKVRTMTFALGEEADESLGWLEFVEAATLHASAELTRLIGEVRELVAIFSFAYGTARRNQRRIL